MIDQKCSCLNPDRFGNTLCSCNKHKTWCCFFTQSKCSKKFNELNNIDIKEWNDAFYNIRTKINTSLHLKSIYFLRKYFINKLINFIKRGKNDSN